MLMSPQNLPERIRAIEERVARAAREAGRSAHSVTLLAIGKAQPPEWLAAGADCGLRHFGESYLKEALAKIAALRERNLTWHFVGRVQANKTRSIATSFEWVHALDRLKIAERLAAQRPFHAPPLNVCLQVNLAGEAAKGGVAPAELPALAVAVAALPRLKLRGLMCIAPQESDPARQRSWFARLRVLGEELNAGAPFNDADRRLDTLSMGMSADFEAAIAEGATIVRLGTALFGARPVQ
jgi:PLP dependent protein